MEYAEPMPLDDPYKLEELSEEKREKWEYFFKKYERIPKSQ